MDLLKELEITGNYATKILNSLKKTPHQFKLYNKHVFYQGENLGTIP